MYGRKANFFVADVPAGDYTLVFSQYTARTTGSCDVFLASSACIAEVGPVLDRFPHKASVTVDWTPGPRGTGTQQRKYFDFPQVYFSVSSSTDVLLSLDSGNRQQVFQLALYAGGHKLLWNTADRVYTAFKVCCSHRRGSNGDVLTIALRCTTQVSVSENSLKLCALPAGAYTVILSPVTTCTRGALTFTASTHRAAGLLLSKQPIADPWASKAILRVDCTRPAGPPRVIRIMKHFRMHISEPSACTDAMALQLPMIAPLNACVSGDVCVIRPCPSLAIFAG